MVGELDSALRNQLNAESIATLGLCTFRAGDTWNIIPETAFLSGSARYFDKEAGPQVLDLIKKSAEATASIHRCTVTYEPTTKVILEPVINDSAVAARVSDGLAEMCGADVLDQAAAAGTPPRPSAGTWKSAPARWVCWVSRTISWAAAPPTITANSTLTNTPWSSVPAPSWCSH